MVKNQTASVESEIIECIRKIYRTSVGRMFSKKSLNELSYGKLHMLKVILDGHKTMTDISKTIGVAMPTATAIVNKLKETGLVKRSPSKNDRRVTEIVITNKGQKTLEASIEAKANHVKMFLSSLSQKDKLTLSKILKKITGKL